MRTSQFQAEVASAYERLTRAAKETGRTPHEIAGFALRQLADDPEARSIIAAAVLRFPTPNPNNPSA